MANDIEDGAQYFEGSLMILRKDKNGWVFGLSVHPNEAPTPLLDAPLGTRFRCVLFQIGDDEKIVVPAAVHRSPEVAKAGELCRDPSVRQFMAQRFYEQREGTTDIKDWNPIDEAECSHILKKVLGVQSRAELSENKGAADQFREIVGDFIASKHTSIYDGGPG